MGIEPMMVALKELRLTTWLLILELINKSSVQVLPLLLMITKHSHFFYANQAIVNLSITQVNKDINRIKLYQIFSYLSN